MKKETLEMWERRHHPHFLVVFLATKRVKRWLNGCRVTSVFEATFQHLYLSVCGLCSDICDEVLGQFAAEHRVFQAVCADRTR